MVQSVVNIFDIVMAWTRHFLSYTPAIVKNGLVSHCVASTLCILHLLCSFAHLSSLLGSLGDQSSQFHVE